MLRQQMKDGNPAERFDAVYQLFHEMDEGHKEYLMPEEFANLTSSLGIILSASELKDAVDTIDEDGNGQIEVDEYLDWWGDKELIELYNARRDALESGKPYRMMSDKVAGESPAERLSIVREMFSDCDVGDKDYLNPWEFQNLSEGLGVKLLDAELETIIEEIDEDGNGQIEVDEYLAWWGDEELIELYEAQVEALESKKPYKLFAGKISKKANTRRKRLTSVNDLFDTNDVGNKEYLTPKEFDKLSKLLGVYLTPKELVEAVEEIDEDGNGQIEIDEYLAWWGDPDLIELYEADEAGETIPSVEEEEANAEEVSSDDEDDDDDVESGNAGKNGDGDKDEDDEASNYSSAYPNHQALEHTNFQRVDYIVAAHQRLTDLHNFAYFWEFLSKGEVLATLHRLGWLNVFDPVSPDRRHYMDLDSREMQLVAKVLVRLAVVEPGENWLYENFMDKPGWELPVTWINTIPSEGRLTLTYSSTAKGCAPVWEERIKCRKYCLIPNDAPLPFESGGMASLKTDAAPITYPMFMRIMTTEESTIDCLGKAKDDAQRIEEEKRRRDEDEDSVDAEEAGQDEDGTLSSLAAAPPTSPDGGKNGVEGDKEGDKEGEAVANEPLVKAKSKYRAPKSKGERNAYAFLETCKKHFLGMYGESSDLEECLAQEWDSFCEQCEGRLGEDKNLAKAFKNLRAVFDILEW
jgi:Ca2+-binding EF-hand superfamily protein